MGHWVVQKKVNYSLLVGILGVVLAGIGFMVVMAIYLASRTS